MLTPKFLLTKTVPITIYRKTQGGYVDGDWVDGAESEITRDVNIQPVRDDELLILPESDRSREWYKLYCSEDLRVDRQGSDGYSADEFMWQGDRYKIMKVRSYAMGTLNHYRAWAARKEISAN